MYMFIMKIKSKQVFYIKLEKMKKLIIVFMGIILFAGVASAQDDADTAWKIKSDVSLMFSQTAFNNWAAGGDNNITLNGFFNFYAGYIKGKSKWENFLALAYGQSKVGKQDFRKNEDKIDFQSTYGYKAAEKWYYTANFNFKSQFAPGYDFHDDDPIWVKKRFQISLLRHILPSV